MFRTSAIASEDALTPPGGEKLAAGSMQNGRAASQFRPAIPHVRLLPQHLHLERSPTWSLHPLKSMLHERRLYRVLQLPLNLFVKADQHITLVFKRERSNRSLGAVAGPKTETVGTSNRGVVVHVPSGKVGDKIIKVDNFARQHIARYPLTRPKSDPLCNIGYTQQVVYAASDIHGVAANAALFHPDTAGSVGLQTVFKYSSVGGAFTGPLTCYSAYRNWKKALLSTMRQELLLNKCV